MDKYKEFDDGDDEAWNMYLHPLARAFDKYDHIIKLRGWLKTLYASMRHTLRVMRSAPKVYIVELDDVVKRYDTTMTLYIDALKEGKTHLQDLENRGKIDEYIERLHARRKVIIDKWLDIKGSMKPQDGTAG